jgi:hypothetical protein
VREKENYILRREAGGDWRAREGASPPTVTGEGIELLTDKCRELERCVQRAPGVLSQKRVVLCRSGEWGPFILFVWIWARG